MTKNGHWFNKPELDFPVLGMLLERGRNCEA